jgi:hypothetical protein
VANHAELSADRWSGFTFEQQVLMIANEMNRGARLMRPEDRSRLLHTYERVLALTDLTIRVQHAPTRRRELLRWRDLIAQLYVDLSSDSVRHAEAFGCLLRFTPESFRQIPFVHG